MRKLMLPLFVLFSIFGGCSSERGTDSHKHLQKAVFAGGCFWRMEPPFEELEGVKDVISGYTGGHKKNPTYEEISSGSTGHYEAVEITYDPEKISYEQLLEVLWKNIDPTDEGGSFTDRGQQYSTAIFYQNDEQRRLAELSKEKLEKSGTYKGPVVTKIIRFDVFYKAEDYHQDYYKKNPLMYKLHREKSGCDTFLKKVWEGNKNK